MRGANVILFLRKGCKLQKTLGTYALDHRNVPVAFVSLGMLFFLCCCANSVPGLPDGAKFGKYCQKSLFSKNIAFSEIPFVTIILNKIYQINTKISESSAQILR